MRAAFIQGLMSVAQRDPRIMLITGDLGYRFLEPFRERFPKRFLNIGVAEANLVTVAAGLSHVGFIPFIYSIATFATLRPFEQIRTDIAMMNANVKIVGIGAGLAYTKAGLTHYSMEDIALMRTMSNMVIIAPRDTNETIHATSSLVKHKGPAYLRLERNPRSTIRSRWKRFMPGRGEILQLGSSGVAIVATGTKVELALDVAKRLSHKKKSCTVVAMPTIAPLDTVLLRQLFTSHTIIATIEEHRVSGGLGTAIGEYLLEAGSPKIRCIKFGLRDEITTIAGSYDYLASYHGLTVESISAKLTKTLRYAR